MFSSTDETSMRRNVESNSMFMFQPRIGKQPRRRGHR